MKNNFTKRVLIALGIGAVIGLLFAGIENPKLTTTEKTVLLIELIRPIGNIYLGLLRTIIGPLVIISIIKSFTSLGNENKLSRIGIKAIAGLLITTGIGATVGIIFASVTNLGSGFAIENLADRSRPVKNLFEVIQSWFPDNLIADLNTGGSRIIAVAVFAIFIAIAIIKEGKKHPERIKPFMDLVESTNFIILRFMRLIINFTPIGIFPFIAIAFAKNANDSIVQYAIYLVVIYLALIFHFVVVHLGLITFGAKLNPIRFVKKIFPAQVVAFTTQSSYGTLPVTIKSLTNRVGVSDRIAAFVAPIGATMGMNACGGIYPAMVSIITANAFGINLSWFDYILIILVSAFASIGIAGVPGTAIIAATVVLTYLGLPLEGIALVYAVDSLVDMGRTALNVTGVTVISTLVAKSEGELDLDTFNADQTEVLDVTHE
jgi:Na+/H+-dicarboxylate symporter